MNTQIALTVFPCYLITLERFDAHTHHDDDDALANKLTRWIRLFNYVEKRRLKNVVRDFRKPSVFNNERNKHFVDVTRSNASNKN